MRKRVSKRQQTAKAAAKAAKAAKISEKARRRREAEYSRPRYSIANPPTSFTITVQQLAELLNRGINQTYTEVKEGRWPTLPRPGDKGPFEILTVPTLKILRGAAGGGEAAAPSAATPLRTHGRSEERTPTT